MEKVIHTIDAKGKRVGRIATGIANILNGKSTPMYSPNKSPNVKVIVENVTQLLIYPKEKSAKKYEHFTGYPGGRKIKSMREVIEKHGVSVILKKAVYGMIPDNKLRKEKMKLLVIKE